MKTAIRILKKELANQKFELRLNKRMKKKSNFHNLDQNYFTRNISDCNKKIESLQKAINYLKNNKK